MSNFSYIEYWKKLKSNEIFTSLRNFSWKVSPEIGYVIQIAKNIPYILNFWSKV